MAAMSYAALRNALGDRDYVAAYLGHVSDETQRLLNRFGFQPPSADPERPHAGVQIWITTHLPP